MKRARPFNDQGLFFRLVTKAVHTVPFPGNYFAVPGFLFSSEKMTNIPPLANLDMASPRTPDERYVVL